MPARLSKFSVPATCKEYVHPWTDSCISSTAGLGLHALQESLKIYTTIYVLSLLMRKKVPTKDNLKKTILGIIQSTVFLSWSSFTYAMFLCNLRHLLGNFNILTVSFIPSFLSSFAAIILERPSRRTLLSLYVSNIATETLFRMMVWRGYVSPIPRADMYIMAASMATLLYLFRSRNNNKDSFYGIIRFVLGKYEEGKHMKRLKCATTNVQDQAKLYKEEDDCKSHPESTSKRNYNLAQRSLNVYRLIIMRLKALATLRRHNSCPHPESCVDYILRSSAQLFGCGVLMQLLLKSIFQVKRIIKRPKLLRSIIFRKDNLKLGLFVGGFTALYKFISCTLRRILNDDSEYIAIPAGLLASATFMFYPNNTIALTVMWKALHLLWNNGVENKKVPEIKWFVIFLYCFSTAVLFHAAIIEPQNLRASYWKFLVNLSGGRVAAMSRLPLDEFGLNTSSSLQKVLRLTNTTDQYIYSF